MTEDFATMLAVGGKKNTLGRAEEVVQIVLNDQSRLEELYQCLFEDDAWLRMRAIDALEKVCRIHPQWLLPYLDRLLSDVASNNQPSIQWHLAEIFNEIELTTTQRTRATKLMKHNLADVSVDWIVAANTMTTLTQFAQDGHLPVSDVVSLLKIQQDHHSKAVVKRATKLLDLLK